MESPVSGAAGSRPRGGSGPRLRLHASWANNRAPPAAAPCCTCLPLPRPAAMPGACLTSALHCCCRSVGFIEGLTLGGVLGGGGQGKVYKGARLCSALCNSIRLPLSWAALPPGPARLHPHQGHCKHCNPTGRGPSFDPSARWPRACAGRWRGTPVAVKVIQTTVAADSPIDLSREPLLRRAPLLGWAFHLPKGANNCACKAAACSWFALPGAGQHT